MAVLGCGESGVGAAILAESLGMDVWVSDQGNPASKYVAELDLRGIPHEEGKHTEEKILDADYIVKSPGIPPTAPLVEQAVSKGIPVLSEIEFAGWFTDATMVCITGSNGKTTTTMLIHHILRDAGLDAALAGNVGFSLARQVAEEPHEVYVIELSSFQLENMYDFRANVAILLNITPDHMDRYDHSLEKYAAAKFRIMRNQTGDDSLIYWMGDQMISEHVEESGSEARRLPFSDHPEKGAASWLDKGTVTFALPKPEWQIQRDRLALKGLHNLYNSMAAGLAASVLKVDADSIRKSLEDFEAVPHRLEFAGEIDGVRYINDSKATNVNSTWYALESMTTPTVLILGGKDKGNDYTEIEPLVKEKVKAIVCMGVDNGKLLDFFEGKVATIADCHSLEEAMLSARALAEPGDTVLLSPCCASFDLFRSYEDRGDRFKAAVANMK